MRYFTTFATNPLTTLSSSGATLTDVATPAVYGGGSLRISGANLNYRGDYAAVPSPSVSGVAATDFEVLALFQLSGADASALLEVANSAVGPANQVSVFMRHGIQTLMMQAVRNSVGVGNSNENMGFTPASATWYWMRLRKRANVYGATAWQHGAAEPTSDISQLTVSSFATYSASFFGFQALSQATSRDIHINYLSVGTAGDIAFRPYKTLDAHVRDGGVWKQPDPVYVRDGGIWKPADVHVRDAGSWKKVHGL